jgi:cell division septum initiation protein DivIVA
MAVATDVIRAGVIEHDGMLWKPSRGATASAGEFITARTLFIELHNDAMWNPWIRDERAADIDAAAEVMGQWQRAEPGHRHLSLKQWEAHQARRERKREQQRAKDEARRERDKARYDEGRATARLRLIEVQSSLDHGLTELAGLRDGTKFPAMDPRRRASEIEELEQKVERLQAEVDRLTPIVGDPEDVVDEHGWLPRDWREHTWWSYRLNRECEVRDLKQRLPELEAALEATTDRAERRDRRAKLAETTRDLERLIAEGPFTADEMCSECATPMAHHGWVWPPGHPCPAWPGWAARMREVRQMLESFAKRREAEAVPLPKPKPQALAVVPSGLPIAEVVAKLTELQAQLPDAEVRRGRANRWELWAPDDAE